METIFAQKHTLHAGTAELYDGRLVDCFEKPERVELILKHIRQSGLGPVGAPEAHGLDPLRRVHAVDYLEFLETAWADWSALRGEGDALPTSWPVRSFSQQRPAAIDGRLGFYSMDAATPITSGTWEAALGAVDATLTALDQVQAGARGAYALVRPPGHHASRDVYGGYCFLNNAAIAAQRFVDETGGCVAILDVDYHHGNGTQSIFYDRSDVLFLSIHGDPNQEFPYYLGYATEQGEGAGEGFNRNFPLPWGTTPARWFEALRAAHRHIEAYQPDLLIVSLGVDTFRGDPISHFLLDHDDFARMGEAIAGLALPTLFVQEGGYAVEEIGVNVVQVLGAFDAQVS